MKYVGVCIYICTLMFVGQTTPITTHTQKGNNIHANMKSTYHWPDLSAFDQKVCYSPVGVAMLYFLSSIKSCSTLFFLTNLTVSINILWVWPDTLQSQRLLILLWSNGDHIPSSNVISSCQ